MKASDIREKSDKELQEDLAELQKSLFSLRMQGRSAQNARHHRFGETRRDIARVKTIMLERERAAMETENETDNE